MGGSFVENQPASSSSLNSSPVRINLDATFAGDLQPLRVTAQGTPDMTVQVAGDNDRAYVEGNEPLDYAGGNSPSFSMPAGGGEKQIDLLHINRDGTLSITTGTPTTGTPSPPTYPGDEMVVAEIFLRQGGTIIKDADDSTNGYVYKDRSPILNLGGGFPTGGVMPYGGATEPNGFLFCDGEAHDATADTSKQALFDVIGNTFGGSDNTDFQMPDMRGNLPLGKDNMGGSSRNRVTHVNADTVGAEQGSETHTLTTAELAVHAHSHSHTQKFRSGSGGTTDALRDGNAGAVDGSATGVDATTTGSGNAHENMSPYMTLNYIIKK